MNLVAASRRTPHVYVARFDRIIIYDTPAGEGVNELVRTKDEIERPFEDDGSEGYIFLNHVPLKYSFA